MKKLLFLVLVFLQSLCFANGPVSSETLQKIETLFLDNGSLSQMKVNQFKAKLHRLQKDIESNIKNIRTSNNAGLAQRGVDPKKKSKNKFIRQIKFLQNDFIDRAFLINSPTELIEHLSNVIDIDNALKIQIIPHDFSKIAGQLKVIAGRYYLEKPAFRRNPQPANLINPLTNKYYTTDDLDALSRNGIDISRFDPPKNNGTVEQIDDISRSDVARRFREGHNEMHEGIKVKFPEKNIAYLKEIRKTQSRVKLIIETKDDLGNTTGEYKLKMGLEVHSEATSAALAVALGMYQDLSKHVRNIKVYTGSIDFNNFVKDFTSYFAYEELEKLVIKNGYDEIKQQYFIVFNEGVLEHRFKSDKLERIGPMYPGLRKGKREARALTAFNLWIGNGDQKPGENNKLLRRRDKNQLFYSQHDLGFGYGYLKRERPTDFRWDLVLKNDHHGILFDFRNIVPSPYLNIMNFNDGKWMVRKIAQLTRQQITTAVKFGKWPNVSPYNYEQLIIEKLINRRNQLVEAFELLGETQPNGLTIKLMAVNRDIEKDAIPTTKLLHGFTSDFRPELKYAIINPILEKTKNLFLDSASNLVANIGRADVPHSWIGIDNGGVITQVLFGSGKKVIKNPNPKNIDERYLVRETFKIGTRLGYGEIFTADSAIVKEYSLIYPVRDESKVSLRGKWIVDFSVPYSIMKNFLPEKHILISETYLEGRGRLRIEFPTVGPGSQATLSRIQISKKVMFTDDGKTQKLFSDKSNFNRTAQSIFTKLAILRLNHFISEQDKGKFQRSVYDISSSDTNSVDGILMNAPIKSGNTSNFVLSNIVTSDFKQYGSRWRFFSFFLREKTYSNDDILVFEPDENGRFNKVSHQVEGRYVKRKGWKKLIVSEEKVADISMSSLVNDNQEIIKPEVVIDFVHHDSFATNFELDHGYIPFFNGVARDKNFIKYNASEHAIDQNYGEVEVGFKEIIREEGIKKLLTLDRTTYFRKMSKLFGLDNILTHPYKYVSYQGRSYKRLKLIKKSKKVINWIISAQNNNSYTGRVHNIVKALGSALPKKGQSQNPILLATLNSFMGAENFYLEAFISPPIGVENKFPGGIIPFNTQGSDQGFENRSLTKLRAYEAVDLWSQFNN